MLEVKKFQKKPDYIEAVQVPKATSDDLIRWLKSLREIADWCSGRVVIVQGEAWIELTHTGGGVGDWKPAYPTDWILRENFLFMKMRDETFHKLYEETS